MTDCCEYHPGEPVFHDADKLWSCCNKRSRDFTLFLSMPGCTKGPHNSTKPSEPPKYVPTKDEVQSTRAPAPKRKDRPSFDSKKLTIENTIADSLRKVGFIVMS